jgi:23S rRNA pseudouridine1911/1915/1917 synthase
VETSKPPALTLTLSEAEVQPFIGQRLDVFLAAVLQRSRTQVQALLKKGLVDMQPAAAKAEASYRLRAGDSVTVQPGPVEPVAANLTGEAIPLDIIYEDDALIALNKQPGLVVHPAAGHWSGTLVNALIHHCGAQLAGRGGLERLGIVHRLDKDTSGVILVAKTDAAHEKLSAAFASREVKKFYRALCVGKFRQASGSLYGQIGRHPKHRKKMTVITFYRRGPENDAHRYSPRSFTQTASRGRSAWTDYRLLLQSPSGAEVECQLHTGRTHQIRVHLSHLGHPIWGDTLYGRKTPIGDFYPARQMLHAARIEIVHPVTGKELKLEAKLPEDYINSRRILLSES